MNIRKWNNLPIIIALFSLLALPTFTAATEIIASPSSVELETGSTATISYILDEVPGGLVGYGMHISLTNPACARISAVSYPAWAILNATQGVPGSEVILRGVDLGKAVGNGESSISVATLTIQGIGAGTCMVVTSELQFDDDSGNVVMVDPEQAIVTVSGSTPSGTSSGGSSGSSVTGTATTQNTSKIPLISTPTSTATMAVVAYAAPWETGEVPVSEEIALAADTKNAPLQGAEPGTGIPGTALLIGAGLLIIVGIAAFIVMKKRY